MMISFSEKADDDASAVTVCVEGEVPGKAMKQPLTRESVEKQMRKTGGSSFEWDDLQIEVEDGLFMPVVQLNELRRNAFSALKEEIQKRYQRKDAGCREQAEEHEREEKETSGERTQGKGSLENRPPELGGLCGDAGSAESGDEKLCGDGLFGYDGRGSGTI